MQMGLFPEILPADIDETALPEESPAELTQRLARLKAREVFRSIRPSRAMEDAIAVLGADTVVVIDQTILGKPKDYADGMAMLKHLSGRTHQVYSAVALVTHQREYQALSVSEVTFRPLSDSMIEAYWQSGEPQDKAGAYGIQGLGAIFVTHLKGSYSGVMGLPIAETFDLLSQSGLITDQTLF